MPEFLVVKSMLFRNCLFFLSLLCSYFIHFILSPQILLLVPYTFICSAFLALVIKQEKSLSILKCMTLTAYQISEFYQISELCFTFWLSIFKIPQVNSTWLEFGLYIYIWFIYYILIFWWLIVVSKLGIIRCFQVHLYQISICYYFGLVIYDRCCSI